MPTSAQDELRADCGRCVGLCCIVLNFQRSADFAEDKPGGVACRHLDAAQACTIHARLEAAGYAGCTVFECFGAGQRLSVGRTAADVSPGMLSGMRGHMQALWLLREGRSYLPSVALVADIDGVEASLRARMQVEDLSPVVAVAAVLRQISEEVRGRYAGPGSLLRGHDLVGRDLRQRDLRAADLRGARLMGAQLQGVDLSGTDLTGADLRGSRLMGANLAHALFVHQSQLQSARGDQQTRVPAGRVRPEGWAA